MSVTEQETNKQLQKRCNELESKNEHYSASTIKKQPL